MNNESRPKTIILSGGGTGGHITPILAVAHQLKQQDPNVRIVYVRERGNKFAEVTDASQVIDETRTIWAGKYRRYYGESALQRLLDVKTNLLNIRDSFYFLIGTVQSWFLLGALRPDAILLKGGFVGVPVGFAAAARHIPFVTHDSDAIPGLANRMVGRWAVRHAVAQQVTQYTYPQSRTEQVGVLLEPDFKEVSEAEQGAFKQQLGIDPSYHVLLVTGGSSGAQRLNEAVVKIVDKLLTDYPDLYVIHQVGKGKAGVYGTYTHPRLQVLEFMRPMFVYTGVSDVVVARSSGNTIAELGAQAKAVIAVPSPFLTGGHQIKNAEQLQAQGAALVVSETAAGTDVAALDVSIRELLDDPARRRQLAATLHGMTIMDAAHRLAAILLDIAQSQ
jgi:UDP-N-acetylglucosamine--N-acetylmuramyl-(pentapeptide) pyrophosphoryl-undecaprenol N-acetylglucosamine transferase